ncbi:uncharacterized protein LOC108669257 [Hyalella azteca]|uniref:Uncharacterized protein LOC108669257 n=1 Tax=Hyalella azteca TaxID=294128 RepID=A0A8B7NEM4_HYAAZ|nr:uncharacterized protein LOC108669257 [Hyalella azteca]
MIQPLSSRLLSLNRLTVHNLSNSLLINFYSENSQKLSALKTFQPSFGVHQKADASSGSNEKSNASINGLVLSLAQKRDVLAELNHASVETLQEYGLKLSAATALCDCRPLTCITQLESVPGIGKKLFRHVCQNICLVSSLNEQPLRPLIPKNFQLPKNLVAVTVMRGCICYCHLFVEHAAPQALASTSSLQVELLDAGLVPIETSDSKLHPYKLYVKVEEAMKNVPEADIYVMPNLQYGMYTRKLSATDTNIKCQLAQVTGMLQAMLITKRTSHSPVLYHVRESFINGLFNLKVGSAVMSNLPLLRHLLAGTSLHSIVKNASGPVDHVPRVAISSVAYERCLELSNDDQRTLAPALYCSLAFCAILSSASDPASQQR